MAFVPYITLMAKRVFSIFGEGPDPKPAVNISWMWPNEIWGREKCHTMPHSSVWELSVITCFSQFLVAFLAYPIYISLLWLNDTLTALFVLLEKKNIKNYFEIQIISPWTLNSEICILNLNQSEAQLYLLHRWNHVK